MNRAYEFPLADLLRKEKSNQSMSPYDKLKVNLLSFNTGEKLGLKDLLFNPIHAYLELNFTEYNGMHSQVLERTASVLCLFVVVVGQASSEQHALQHLSRFELFCCAERVGDRREL